MKKKILSLLLAICMFVPMTFSLVACDDEKDPTGTEATQQSSGKEETLGAENITLSYTSTVYDGTEKEPAVILTYDDKVIASDNYTVSYSNNVNAGTATVVVTSNADSEVLAEGLTLTTTFEIERHPIYVASISQLNAAIQLTDANHVIKLTKNIALERDASNSVVPVLIFPREKNYDVSIDLAGFDINSYFRIVSFEKINNQEVKTENTAVVNIFNSSNEESVVGAADDQVEYAVILKAKNKFDVDFNNVTFKAYWGGITSNGLSVSETTVSAEDCKFISTKATASDGYDAGVGAYLVSGKHIYTFENCTFEGFGGYYTKAGHHTLIDCTVNAVGATYFNTKVHNNGCWVTGSALMVDSSEKYNNGAAAGYPKPLTVDIVGGRYTSASKYALEEFCTYETTRTCYANIHITDGAEFEGAAAFAKDVSIEDVNVVFGSEIDFDHNHVHIASSDNENHFDKCNCGDIINVEAHTFTNTVVIPATFTEDGVLKKVCTECGKEITVPYAYATERTAIYVSTLEELNNAIKTTDENQVIVLENDIVDASATEVYICPEGKDYDVAIDLAGYDLKGYFNIKTKNKNKVETTYNAKVYIFNSSNEESVVGCEDNSIVYALQVMSGNEFEVNLKNVTFKAFWGGMATSGNYAAETVINAWNCNFIATKADAVGKDKKGNEEVSGEHASVGAYLVAAKYVYNFDTCVFEGYSAYYVKNGHHNLINCTMTAFGQISFAATRNGSGANVTGSALIIDSCEGYNNGRAEGYDANLTVNIVDGRYTSAAFFAIQEYTTCEVEANRVCYAKVTVSGNVVLEANPMLESDYSFENPNVVTGLN